LLLNDVLRKLPSPLKIPNARGKIKYLNKMMKNKLIVLDDDPTGCQTVHDIEILMVWDSSSLKTVFEKNDVFYILTNSRAYSEDTAMSLNRSICQNLLKVSDKKQLRIISRSDSTLRGHFYAEIITLAKILGPFDGVVIAPYFKEGKRLTIFDTHYILENGNLIEVNKTEYSKDPVFGYKNAYLPAWVEEKSRGLWKKEEVISIKVEKLRTEGPRYVSEILKKVQGFKPIIVNSLCDEDMEVFVLGLLEAEKEGKRFLYRTAASFVKIRAGIPDKDLYVPLKQNTGLIIVGSYVQKTTQQLHYLLKTEPLERLEIKLKRVFNDKESYINEIVKKVDVALKNKQTFVIYTERKYGFHGSRIGQLKKSQELSNFLAEIVDKLYERPDFIIAKGGITSFDIAKKGLRVKKAFVLGQISPGVPIWKLGRESKYPDLLYIVFPGNVGEEKTLHDIFRKITRGE